MAEDDLVVLEVEGRRFSGWKNATVVRSLQQGAGTFEVETTEVAPERPSARALRHGAPVRVQLGADTVLTGYIDATAPSYDGRSHRLQVSGRDAVGDLVDCAPNLETATWKDITAEEAARNVAEPFGIPVRADVDVGKKLSKVALSPGQFAWDLIEQVCRYRALLPVSDGEGGLLLTRAGTARAATALVKGQNILQGSGAFSWANRHSEYVVKGQRQSFDDDDGESVGRSVGRARDEEIDRARPLLVVADRGVDAEQCERLAKWMATTRAGRGSQATYTVQGWRDGRGALWPVNALVPVSDPFLGINRDMLIAQVTFVKDETSTLTTLEVVRPDAFAEEPQSDPEPVGFDA